jgi:hypothetical protein
MVYRAQAYRSAAPRRKAQYRNQIMKKLWKPRYPTVRNRPGMLSFGKPAFTRLLARQAPKRANWKRNPLPLRRSPRFGLQASNTMKYGRTKNYARRTGNRKAYM